ncbi:TetR/AcrR family transcriptional regulator [Metabacillus sp. GX 13764]|uniref:TetR/AcrR family transcriptional regulator n=1 Tax=Metabacillus kandeliae TaxID=2900151 RepID=UPI001E3B9D85|nr:TetR/AcrR family transcriptional regulator [Metabacillus kandeliae]MCD7035092.1 TetR/AcrR family transcriptional regulator [Metabacillus kandeliae]
MTAEELKQKALAIFSEHGYEGASLSLIAEEAGIKKQSIYSHFKSKDELFLQTAEDVFSMELEQAQEQLAGTGSGLQERLFSFLTDYMERYESSPETRFWLRMSFFPPPHLYDAVMVQVYRHLDTLEALLTDLFRESSVKADPGEAAVAFLGVLDSLFVEMLYSERERQLKRLHASCRIFWKGINQEGTN